MADRTENDAAIDAAGNTTDEGTPMTDLPPIPTMNALWAEFFREKMAGVTDPVRIQDARVAYYAGASAQLYRLMVALEHSDAPGAVGPDELRVLGAAATELLRFASGKRKAVVGE